VGEAIAQRVADLQAEARLARAAGASQRDEARAIGDQQAGQVGHFLFAADNGCGRLGQVAGELGRREQRREVVGQVGQPQLIDRLRAAETLQGVGS